MMVTLDKVKSGICSYIDAEILSRTMGLSKWFIGAGIVMLPGIIDKKYADMKNLLVEMHITDENDNIDIDTAERILVDTATRYGNVTENISGLKVTLCAEDVRSVARHIRMS